MFQAVNKASKRTACLGFIVAFLCVSCPVNLTRGQKPEFYHSTAEISQELEKLATTCPELSIRREPIDDYNFIDVASISGSEAPVSRFFLLAGEHARELITSESALHFVKGKAVHFTAIYRLPKLAVVLCGEEEQLKDEAREALDDTSFQVILNGNPISRKKVEDGDFCLRVNENAVDLNRNWKAHWSAKASNPETFPGKTPFSEPETQIFRKAVTGFKPNVFLSVHSGTLGMYMPWAYKAAEPTDTDGSMMRIMEDLDKKFCRCPSGPAGEETGYRSPGTCLDFVYDTLNVPFAYAFEIFAQPSQRKALFRQWKSKNEFHDAASDFSGEYRQKIRFLSRSRQDVLEPDSRADSNSCFVQFNPTDEEEFQTTLLNWSEAYLELSKATATALLRLQRP